MFCERCGKEIQEGVKFCSNCGFAINYVNDNNKPLNNGYKEVKINERGQTFNNPNINMNYQRAMEVNKQEGEGFGIASLVLGILSILSFLFLGPVILAPIAIIFGIIQIVSKKKKGLAIAGIATAVVGIIFMIVFYVWIINFAMENGEFNTYNNGIYDYSYSDFNFE